MSVTDFSPFLAVHIDLPRNRKTYALARLLSEKRTSIVGMLVSFWAWALENALDGKLDPDPNLIADIMEWEHDKNLLVNSLVVSKWIDIDDNGQWSIHDWDDHTGDFQGKRAKRLQQNREAQARHRAELKLISDSKTILLPEKCKPTKHDVSMTSALRQDDVSVQQNRTEHNPNTNTNTIFSLWNEQKIKVHKKLTPDITYAISKILKVHSEEEVCRVIKNYGEIVTHPETYWFGYKWSLKDFLSRGFDKFDDLEVAKANYKSKGGQNGTNQRYSKQGGTKLPDRDTGYTPAPPDPALDALVAAQRDGDAT